MPDSYYLGFDLSTQQLKCLAINQDLKIVHSETVDFDKELPRYKTEKGVYVRGTVTDCPVAMWVEAIDLVFFKYKKSRFDLNKVTAISGSAQQHGSIFWSNSANKLLENLDGKSEKNLLDQLAPSAFARQTAPNWQDHSTEEECREMEDAVGGPQEMAEATGSRAHFRFTGPQILKIAKEETENYSNTKVIALVSSFLQSVLCGKLTPLEEADACGMNLYNIENHDYDSRLTSLIDRYSPHNGIREKLMGKPLRCDKFPIWSNQISRYFTEKYDLNPLCSIFPFTGDNLATLCSLPLQKNDVLVSMGTSTTVLLVTDNYAPSPNHHLFIHPTIPNHYMAMICYCNGSLAREKIRDEMNNNTSGDWEAFDRAVLDKEGSTSTEIGIYFPLGEIVPSVNATYKRAKFDIKTGEISELVDKFGNDAKNIVESQALSCRARITPLLFDKHYFTDLSSEKIKFDYSELPISEYSKSRPNRVFFVGGASKNDAIVKKYADILGAKNGNYRFSNTSNSCALGGCYKALWSHLSNSQTISSSFDELFNTIFNWENLEVINGTAGEAWKQYTSKLKALGKLEALL